MCCDGIPRLKPFRDERGEVEAGPRTGRMGVWRAFCYRRVTLSDAAHAERTRARLASLAKVRVIGVVGIRPMHPVQEILRGRAVPAIPAVLSGGLPESCCLQADLRVQFALRDLLTGALRWLHLVRRGGTRLLELPSQEILELGVVERIAVEQHPTRPAAVFDPEVTPEHLGLNVLVLNEDPLHSSDG